MSDRKFEFEVQFSYKDEKETNPVRLGKIFGDYVMSSFTPSFVPEIVLSTREATAKEHLSKLSKWKQAFRRLYKRGWNGSGDFMWVFIYDEGGLGEKLKVFFDKYRIHMEELAEANYGHMHGLLKSDFFGGVRIEFGGLDISDVNNAVNTLKMRILLVDAILDYCDSRSIEDIKREIWGNFRDSIKNIELLLYIIDHEGDIVCCWAPAFVG